MRRSRLMPLSGLFFNTRDRQEKTVDESFTYSRHYADTINEGMMEDERLQQKREAEEQNKTMQDKMHHDPELKSNHRPGPKSEQTCL